MLHMFLQCNMKSYLGVFLAFSPDLVSWFQQRQPAPVASAITSSASSYGYNQPVPAQYPAPPYPRTQQGQYQQY